MKWVGSLPLCSRVSGLILIADLCSTRFTSTREVELIIVSRWNHVLYENPALTLKKGTQSILILTITEMNKLIWEPVPSSIPAKRIFLNCFSRYIAGWHNTLRSSPFSMHELADNHDCQVLLWLIRKRVCSSSPRARTLLDFWPRMAVALLQDSN